MAITEASRFNQPVEIQGGVPKSVEILMNGATSFSMTIKHLSGADIDSVDVESRPLEDGDYGPDTEVATAIGTIAAGVTRKIDVDGISFMALRLTFHAASDASCHIKMRGEF